MAFSQKYLSQARTKRKYNNRTTIYKGIAYDSIKEAQYAEELDWRLKAGEIQGWERQVKISLDVNGKHIANYYCDFKVYNNDGSVEYHEVKGFATGEWKLKWSLFQALIQDIDPGAELIVIKV